jgi:type II secretory pathway component PulF
MTDFLYKALDAHGQFVSGRLQAASTSAAVQQLVELGYVPLDTKPSTTERRWRLLSCSRISLCCCDRDYR